MEQSAQAHGQPPAGPHPVGNRVGGDELTLGGDHLAREAVIPPITMQIWWDEDVGD